MKATDQGCILGFIHYIAEHVSNFHSCHCLMFYLLSLKALQVIPSTDFFALPSNQ